MFFNFSFNSWTRCAFLLILFSYCLKVVLADPKRETKSRFMRTSFKASMSPLHESGNTFFDPSTSVVGVLEFTEHHAFQKQPYVANGYFGARIPNLGHGFAYDLISSGSTNDGEELRNGWPLFNRRFAGAFAAGFFDLQKNTTGTNFPWLHQYGWDSVISALPQWTFLSLASGDFVLDPALSPKMWGNISDYMQTLSLTDGKVTTLFTWLKKLEVGYEVIANKHDINLGVVNLSLLNHSNESFAISVTDIINFHTAQRCHLVSTGIDEQGGIYIVVTPEGVNSVYGAIHSKLAPKTQPSESVISKIEESSVSQELRTIINPGQTLKILKIVGIFTTDLDPENLSLPEAVRAAAKEVTIRTDLDESCRLHNEAWKKTLGSASLIEFSDSSLLSLASKASVYHINANMRPGALGLTSALSVAGLSSDSYGGQVFWDTDLWILMGILPFNPLVSKSLFNYRLHLREQAMENTVSPSRPKDGFIGAIYPWTSGRFGNCTATGPCFDYEYHINAAISYAAIQLYLSGATDDDYLENVIYPTVLDAALLFSSYLELDERSGEYGSSNLTDPDEFAEFVNNGAYTNAAMSMTIKWATIIGNHLGKAAPAIFTKIIGHIHIPYSTDAKDIVLEYTGMNSSIGVKQADVIMITYPLNNELISKELAISNLMYYARKQVSDGPAMTFLIFSIVSSLMLESGCSSESYLLKSVEPFLRGPFAQFLEQSDDVYESNGGTHPAFPFLTAHGGFLQTILMGILGMRFSHEILDNKIHRILSFKAQNLSLFPNGVKFGEVHYMNASLSIELKNSFLNIKHNGQIEGTIWSPRDIKIVSYSNGGTKELTSLRFLETVSFKVTSRRSTNPHSLTECNSALFIAITPGVQGDIVELMHDGDNSTYWQAQSHNEAKILIDLKAQKLLKGGHINWGDSPARNIWIYARVRSPEPEENFFSSNHFSEHHSSQKANDFLLLTSAVNVSEPYDLQEESRVQMPQRHNITFFEFPSAIECRELMITFRGSHLKAGAKVYDVNFYE